LHQAVASQRAYDKAEKETETDPSVQAVLVSVEDLDSLRKAYPNYYVDTKGFMDFVDAELLRISSAPWKVNLRNSTFVVRRSGPGPGGGPIVH